MMPDPEKLFQPSIHTVPMTGEHIAKAVCRDPYKCALVFALTDACKANHVRIDLSGGSVMFVRTYKPEPRDNLRSSHSTHF